FITVRQYVHSFPTRRSSDLHLYDGVVPICSLTNGEPLTETIGAFGWSDGQMRTIFAAVRPMMKEARAALFVSICMTLLGTCGLGDRKSTRLNSSHVSISYAV